MLRSEDLLHEIRGDIVECVHKGFISIVDDRAQVIHSVGDSDIIAYYRSASKPLQALPVLMRRLDEKFGLTEEESVVMAGSLAADPEQVAVLESILTKTGLREQDFVMKPTWPARLERQIALRMEGLSPRKIYHNCFGKHIGLQLLQRELTGHVYDYERPDSAAQQEVLYVLAAMANWPAEDIGIGIDGCGVPVFAVPLRCIAGSFLRFACPDTIRQDDIAEAVSRYLPRIHKYPYLMRGNGYPCTLLNESENIVAKGGARGVYGFALKKQRLGISFKVGDGDEGGWPIIVRDILAQLGCLEDDLDKKMHSLQDGRLYNDNGTEVGRIQSVFSL